MERVVNLKNTGTKNNTVQIDTSTILKKYTMPYITPLTDGTLIYLIKDSTNQYVYFNGGNYQFTSNKNQATGFKVRNNPDVFNNSLGGVALQTYDGFNADQGYMRHFGFLCRSDPFGSSNYDYAWRFDQVGLNTYNIFNWFGEPDFYLDDVSGFLQISFSSFPLITVWRIEPYYWGV